MVSPLFRSPAPISGARPAMPMKPVGVGMEIQLHRLLLFRSCPLRHGRHRDRRANLYSATGADYASVDAV